MSDFAFCDFETRSLADVTECGAYPYARHKSTDCLVLGWVFDQQPTGQVWSPAEYWGNSEFSTPDSEEPTELLDHIENKGWFVAWNANFDRQIWNEVMMKHYDWPVLRQEQVLCAQAQAEASLLPGKLEKACEALRVSHKKDPRGKQLISKLSNGCLDTWDSEAFETPNNMGHFRSYCLSDCLAMRDVFYNTRPLMEWEWRQYWSSERINDRGVMVDVEFARAAQAYAEAEFSDLNADMLQLTGDPKLTVTNHVRKAHWLYDHLWHDEEVQAMAWRPPKKKAGTDEEVERRSCDRATREAVLEALSQPEHAELFPDNDLDDIIRFLELIEAGNSSAVRKFTAIGKHAFEDRVHGMYSFNGAGQTGRYSSRGVQTHNLINQPVDADNPDRAIDAMDDVMANLAADQLFDLYGFPVSRLLARLIRPTFIAPEGKILVWADWDQIEARVLPWLAKSPGGRTKLELFKTGQDVYVHAAAAIFNKLPKDIDKTERQVGKVSELALGFGGSVGAYSAMGRNFGVVLPEHEVRDIVQSWRAQNSWCVAFWGELWDAAIAAYNHAHTWIHVGRVKYAFFPEMMHGTLVCELPSGRWLVYPQFQYGEVEYENDDGETEIRWRASCVKGFGSGFARVDIWYGTLAENITQACAADFLRMNLVEFDDLVVMHTHDEIVCEVDENEVEAASAELAEMMTWLPDWADGLPLSVSVESGPFYTK